MSGREIEAKAEEILTTIATQNGVTVYDVEYVKEGSDMYLRAYIDKEDGVTIDDCEAVSRAFSDALDAADFIEDAYILEVSSPGLGRSLKKDRHFENSLLMEVEVKTYKPIDGTKEFVGLLKAYDKDTFTIETVDGNDLVFKRSEVALCRLTLDF